MKEKYNKKFLNILCVMFICVAVSIIVFFNYYSDPYMLFSRKLPYAVFNLQFETIDFYPIKLKAFKSNNYNDTVLIGSSDAQSMFEKMIPYMRNDFTAIFGNGIVQSNYYELLDSYLKAYPKTKRVILVLNFVSLVKKNTTAVPKYTGSHFTVKELAKVLLSDETIIESIRNIKHLKEQNYEEETGENVNCLYAQKKIATYQVDNLINEYGLKKMIFWENIKSMNQVFNLLDSKNIEYTVVIPPYNMIFMALIKNMPLYKSVFDDYLRYIVTKADDIYDFAIVNKYTTFSIRSKSCYLYDNYNHPSDIFGFKVYKVLYNLPGAEKDIYKKITKDNIEAVIKEQNQKLNMYKKQNISDFNFYLEKMKNFKQEDFEYIDTLYYDDFPQEAKDEINNMCEFKKGFYNEQKQSAK